MKKVSDEPHAPQRAALSRLARRFFRPQLKWFALGTGLAVLTAMFATAYVSVLAYVGAGIERAIGGEAGDRKSVV